MSKQLFKNQAALIFFLTAKCFVDYFTFSFTSSSDLILMEAETFHMFHGLIVTLKLHF
jgi:hypothetical protein